MNTYTKICLVAGLCTTTYLILKFIKTSFGQEPKNQLKSGKGKVVKKKSTNTSSNLLEKKADSSNVGKSGVSKRKISEKKSEESKKTMKNARPKPNFFLAVQIFDKEIHEKVKKFQEMIIAKNPLLHPALIPVPTLHLTLAVTHLENETEVKRLKLKLEEWAAKNIMSLRREPMVLTFNGVNTFNDIVAFVAIDKSQSYQNLVKLSNAMSDVLSSAGLTNDNRRFTPHLTILKLSRDFGLLKCRKDFKDDFGLMKQCKEYFGKQEVKHIQLLSMSEPKDKNGYYKCFHQINISDVEDTIDHSKCCTLIPEPKVIKGKP